MRRSESVWKAEAPSNRGLEFDSLLLRQICIIRLQGGEIDRHGSKEACSILFIKDRFSKN